MLEVAGIPGFLGNLNELYEASDSDGQTWREFTGAWSEAYREEPKKVSDLTQFCEERDLMLTVRGDGSIARALKLNEESMTVLGSPVVPPLCR